MAASCDDDKALVFDAGYQRLFLTQAKKEQTASQWAGRSDACRQYLRFVDDVSVEVFSAGFVGQMARLASESLGEYHDVGCARRKLTPTKTQDWSTE